MKDKDKEKIEKLIKENPEGLTIQDLVNKSELAWNTITKILALLEGQEKIRIRQVGQAKLHYWIGKDKNPEYQRSK